MARKFLDPVYTTVNGQLIGTVNQVCSYCNAPWTNAPSMKYNLGCCIDDEDNNPERTEPCPS